MFNIIVDHQDGDGRLYSQMSQPNPLRYQFAKRSKDNLYLVGAPMSCRDFFNDAVSAYHGLHKHSHGYHNSAIKFNRYGLYVYYTNISNPEQFVHNIEQAINPRLKQDIGAVVACHVQSENSVVIRIPSKVLEYTWRISLLTQLIRNCNWDISYSDWDSLFTDWPHREGVWPADTKEYAQLQGFVPPFDAWFYNSPTLNSNNHLHYTRQQCFGSIHGNGCVQITQQVQMQNIWHSEAYKERERVRLAALAEYAAREEQMRQSIAQRIAQTRETVQTMVTAGPSIAVGAF